jgi:recombination endonuclease VII
MVSTKLCRDCGQHRPVGDFWRDRRRSDGLAFYCKVHARQRWFMSRDRRAGIPKHRFAREVVVPDGWKWCPDCDTVKPLTDFPRTRANKSGTYTYCKPCHNIRGKASKEKVGGSRTYHLKRRYGITADEADLMLDAQNGLCAICEAAPAAHVDHDHDAGTVRQLLCFNCNGGLGQFKDNPALLRAAADYVERHRALEGSTGSRPEARDETGDPCRQRRSGVSRGRRYSHGFARWQAMQARS